MTQLRHLLPVGLWSAAFANAMVACRAGDPSVVGKHEGDKPTCKGAVLRSLLRAAPVARYDRTCQRTWRLQLQTQKYWRTVLCSDSLLPQHSALL